MKKIWGLFAIYMLIFVLNFFIGQPENATRDFHFVMRVCILILAVLLLIKYKLPNKKQIIISLAFGLVVYAALAIRTESFLIPFGMPILASITSMAFFSITNQHPENSIAMLSGRSAKSVMLTVAIGLGVGIALGFLNIISIGASLTPSFELINFVLPLSPAIYEEMAYRAFFFAACVHFMKDDIFITKEARNSTITFMMVIPHVLVHTPNVFMQNGIASGAMMVLVLSIYGYILAYMQRKRDVTSAMIAHWAINAVTFITVGIYQLYS